MCNAIILPNAEIGTFLEMRKTDKTLMDEMNREQFVQAYNDPFNLFVLGCMKLFKFISNV